MEKRSHRRNVIERLAKPLHAPVRRALRQAWELDDADKAERLLRNLARRLDHEAPGVAASILEGLDEMLTVNRLGLPVKLRRSLACTNSIENMMGTVRPRLSQREAMAKCRDGVALDRRRHDGGSQRLPSIESLQAPAHS
jgi:transposase-like protein